MHVVWEVSGRRLGVGTQLLSEMNRRSQTAKQVYLPTTNKMLPGKIEQNQIAHVHLLNGRECFLRENN